MVTMYVKFLLGFFCLCSLFAADAVVQPAVVVTDAPLCAAQVEGFLEGRLAFWQNRLELQDWRIEIVLSKASDLKPETLGNVHWDKDRKTAVIRVLDAAEYRLPCREVLNDMESTVVHELVHLELSSLPRPTESRTDEEHAVNRITDALLALDRRARP